jgi:hypothetical protein
MKLDMAHNSIRITLEESDLKHLAHWGECQEAIAFPDGSKLEYGLRAWSGNEVAVEFLTGTVFVSVPAKQLQEWQSLDRGQMKAVISLAQGETLDVVIEKEPRSIDSGVADHRSQLSTILWRRY